MEPISIYIDSLYGVQHNDEYVFNLNPAFQTSGTTSRIYLRDFMCLNSIYNITQTTSFGYRIEAGSQQAPSIIKVAPGYYSGPVLAELLNETFSLFKKTDSNNTSSNGDGTKKNDFIVEWNATQLVMSFTCREAQFQIIPGGLADILNIDGDTYSTDDVNAVAMSTQAVDLNQNSHNISISIAEVGAGCRDIFINSAPQIGTRIVKIPVLNSFGDYVTYKATEPVHSLILNNNIFSSFTIRLYMDDGTIFKPHRFTATIVIDNKTDTTHMTNKVLSTILDKLGSDATVSALDNVNTKNIPFTQGDTLTRGKTVGIGQIRKNQYWFDN
jgi:hypothetical protein